MFHAVSESMLKLCREKVGISEDKIRHIANGLDLDKFSPEDSSLARHKHGFKETDFIILGIGSFYPWKNFSLLLTAAKLLKDKNIDFRLVLVGDGPLFDGLKSKAILESLEQHVYFFGYRKDIPDIINMSDCLIQPSLTEGMSNTIMEALACAKPVIASDIAGNKELVRNGINGYLFSSNNVTDLVEKIILIYKDKGSRNRMAEAARKIAEEKFSLKQMVSEYEKLYLEVIDHGSIGH
jgi:glycosyltransferase involved in cell wall biosynthesis